jgi:hypothetical protein
MPADVHHGVERDAHGEQRGAGDGPHAMPVSLKNPGIDRAFFSKLIVLQKIFNA